MDFCAFVDELKMNLRMGEKIAGWRRSIRMKAKSPLQYQKQLRLHVSRERMISAGLDAASDRRRFHVTPRGITLIAPDMLGHAVDPLH